uniref:UDP-glycosyltransferase 1 n=1 Tax=Linum usitatissimum TaxID=4006 RepID=I2BH33_LINUS|nr:UDP-glycosyltransferase 1 [Linum usitatissimum]
MFSLNSTVDDHQLHVFFFPFLAHGHMIPAIDMAKIFASRGVKVTIVTTPLNVPFFSKTISKHSESTGSEIRIQTLKFPTTEFGLPEGCENAEVITSMNLGWETFSKFFLASTKLQESLEKLLEEDRPDCLVADMFFPWATDSSEKFGIPRLLFHGTSFFSLTVMDVLSRYEPHKDVSSDTEPFEVPGGLPDKIMLTKRQLPASAVATGQGDTFMWEFFKKVRESNSQGYGTVVNSFYELEPGYVDYYRNVFQRKAWHIGPVSLCNADVDDKANRGKESSIDWDYCLNWLDSKEPKSVVYICFGSVANFSAEQLKEIAIGIEASDQKFIWVVRKNRRNNGDVEDWLPEGFEERTKSRGIIIRGWAPQVLILEHVAIGAIVTHCGWNSTLEAISAGLPMVTWPVMAEQFYNEKLVTHVVKIGVGVGAAQLPLGTTIEGVKVERAIKRIMSTDDEEVAKMRSRAKYLGHMARKAVEEDGSSYCDLDALIEELRSNCRA